MLDARRRDIWYDILLRLVAAGSVAYFMVRIANAYIANPARTTLILAIIAEIITVLFLLTARRPPTRDWFPLAVVATVFATAVYPLLLGATPGIRLLPEKICVVFQAAGILWTLHAKITLGRSFGLLPANRGIVLRGPYRFVRHPIYLGYAITHIGFLAANLTIQNVVVLAALYLCQLYRIHREEMTLAQSEEYRAYRERVRYRLIYGVY